MRKSDIQINRMRAPCFKCSKRETGCHSKCNKYILFKCADNIDKQKVKAFKKADKDYFDYYYEKWSR